MQIEYFQIVDADVMTFVGLCFTVDKLQMWKQTYPKLMLNDTAIVQNRLIECKASSHSVG